MSDLSGEQKQFLKCTDKNVLLSASAGSGKTTSMVAKIVNLISNDKYRVPLKNILTLTFTRAAANEMKAKLYKAITDKLSEIPDDLFVSQQLDEINTADIGTIDSICIKLVKKYFYIVGVDPAFEIIDEKQEKYLLDKVIKQVCEKAWEQDDYFELYESYLTNRKPEQLYNMVKSIYNYFQVLPDYKQYISYVIDTCYNPDINTNICAKFLLDKAKAMLSPYASNFAKFADLFADEHEKYLDYIKVRLDIVNGVICAKDYGELYNILNLYEKLPPMPTNKCNVGELKGELKLVGDEFKLAYTAAKKMIVKCDTEQFEKVKLYVAKLCDLADKVTCEMMHQKTAQGRYGFADISHFALQILSDEQVQNELHSVYKYIFFDEYQDINPLQDAILQLLSNNNLNLIGDVKQSIYEFRLSTPELFIEKYNSYNGETGQVIKLNENYRSNNSILQFVNTIFNNLITTQTFGIDYKRDAQLSCGLKEHNTHTCQVELNIINKTKQQNDDADGEDDVDYSLTEVNVIVDKIQHLLSKGYKYGDIVILLRDRKDMVSKISEVLNAYHIPNNVDLKVNLFSVGSVKLLCSVLAVVNNPYDDISHASILLSPIGNCSDSDLIEISKAKGVSFYDKLQNYIGQNDLQIKIYNYLLYIKSLRDYCVNHSVEELINKIIVDNDLYAYFKSMPDGIQSVTYVDAFVDILSTATSVSNACEIIETYLQDSVEVKVSKGSTDCVKVSTIHASKGLEYKCVILCSVGKNINFEKDNAINLSKKFGVGIKYQNAQTRQKCDVFVKNACIADKNKNIIDEEIRLLYVALTRAEEELIVVGSYPVDKIKLSHKLDIYDSKTYFDLIFKGLDSSQLGKFESDNSFVLNKGKDNEFVVNIYNEFVIDKNEDNAITLGVVDEHLRNELEHTINYTYPYAYLQNVATKNSVSSILKDDENYENRVDNLSSLYVSNVPNEDALKLGTAYHAVMQQVNYYADNDVQQIIDSLVNQQLIDKQMALLIDVKKVEKAINAVKSKLGQNSKIYKEQQFTMRGKHSEFVLGGYDVFTIIQGVIDLAIEDEDGFVLIDFKTNKADANSLAEMYSKQLNLYEKALQKHSGKQVKEKLLYSFFLGRFVAI